jgi:hypothetical protein
MKTRLLVPSLGLLTLGLLIARAPGTLAQAASPALTYIEGSTTKLMQLLGETDKQLHQPTLSRTVTRYHLEGTDLGQSTEHQGRVYFFFGDTVGALDRGLDTMATTDVRDPEQGVRLDFLTVPGRPYLTIEPPGSGWGDSKSPTARSACMGPYTSWSERITPRTGRLTGPCSRNSHRQPPSSR